MKQACTDEEIEEICEEYKEKKNTGELADRYGVHPDTIRKYLKKNDIERDGNCQRKTELNDNAFSTINEESAYWAGFLMADGSIHMTDVGSNRFKLSISKRDEEHLDKLQEFLDSDYKVSEHNAGYIDSVKVKVEFTSDQLVSDLGNMGVKKDKTFNGNVCKELANNKHFWRGEIDGDGFVSNKGPSFGLRGSKSLLEQFKSFITDFCDTKSSVLEGKSNYNYRVYGSKKVPKITRKLYKNSNIYLDRKYKEAQKVLEKHT